MLRESDIISFFNSNPSPLPMARITAHKFCAFLKICDKEIGIKTDHYYKIFVKL